MFIKRFILSNDNAACTWEYEDVNPFRSYLIDMITNYVKQYGNLMNENNGFRGDIKNIYIYFHNMYKYE